MVGGAGGATRGGREDVSAEPRAAQKKEAPVGRLKFEIWRK